MEKFRNDTGDDLKRRLSDFLLHRYPMNAAKLVASDIRVSPDTAYKWVDGTAFPTRPDHLARMTAVYGRAFLDAVFVPIVQDHITLREARLEAQKRQIERDLQALDEDRRALSSRT
ncbi:hypothetical protein LIHA111178_08015 [Litorimonas haliclonae]